MLEKALRLIAEQQEKDQDNPIIQEIATALIMLAHESSHFAELIAQDLEIPELSLKKCYDAFYAYAKKNQKSGCFAGSTDRAKKLVCDFYGINNPVLQSTAISNSTQKPAEKPAKDDFNILDFL